MPRTYLFSDLWSWCELATFPILFGARKSYWGALEKNLKYRFDSRSGHTEDLKNGTSGLSSLFSVLMGWCNETVRSRCSHWLATVQVRVDGRRRPFAALLQEVQKRVEMKLNWNWFFWCVKDQSFVGNCADDVSVRFSSLLVASSSTCWLTETYSGYIVFHVVNLATNHAHPIPAVDLTASPPHRNRRQCLQ